MGSDLNWRMQLQGWTMFHAVINFFDQYPDKSSILDYYIKVARDWWDNYGNDPNNIVSSRLPDSYAWYDMSVGFRALTIAFFNNRVLHLDTKISKNDHLFLKDLTNKHIEHLLCPEVFSLNNHGLFQAHGLMALIKSTKFTENYSTAKQYASSLMERLIVSQFDENGIHLEHSPHYHFYALNSFKRFLKTGWYNQNQLIKTRISKAEKNCKWLVDPKKRPICVGDSILTLQKDVKFPKDSSEIKLSKFHSSGYAVIRSSWNASSENASMLFVMGAYHSKSHKHQDCLSFDWFDRGDRIIVDGGKYGYISDDFRRYVKSYQAHNTAEIENVDIYKMAPYGSAIRGVFEYTPEVFSITADLEFRAFTHKRQFFFKPGSWLIVCDRLNYIRPRTTNLWLHLESDYTLSNRTEQSFVANGLNREVHVEFIGDTGALSLHKGDHENIRGLISTKDYEIKPALTSQFSLFGKQHNIKTVLSLDTYSKSDAINFVTSLDTIPTSIENLKSQI